MFVCLYLWLFFNNHLILFCIFYLFFYVLTVQFIYAKSFLFFFLIFFGIILYIWIPCTNASSSSDEQKEVAVWQSVTNSSCVNMLHDTHPVCEYVCWLNCFNGFMFVFAYVCGFEKMSLKRKNAENITIIMNFRNINNQSFRTHIYIHI